MPLELPTHHRVPLGWLLEQGNETIRLRTYVELASLGAVPKETVEAATQAVIEAKSTQALVKRQKDNGIWAGNLLGLAPSAAQGIKDVGTIAQYRRLLQIGCPQTGRPFKLADRVLFRLLSRDEDPFLQFEFQKLAKDGSVAAEWARERQREAASTALAEAGFIEDPRIRGSAHKIASAVSQFLRSPLSEKPFARVGSKVILDPEAHPPTWYSVAMVAAMPNLQRERAGFTERLGQYLGQPAPKKAYVIAVGKKTVKPELVLLGDPVEADSKGSPKDIPLALYVIELLARLGALNQAPTAMKVLGRLLADCDDHGVWRPKALKSLPKASHKVTYHWYPLNPETKSSESRVVDVTFRLALIAKLLGWRIEYA